MAKSISQIQQELINDGTIDKIAADLEREGVTGFAETGLIERAIILFAAAFIEKAKENLNASGTVDTGTLQDGLSQGEVRKSGSSYELEVGYPADSPAAKYYDSVNKGVKGFISGTPNSPYFFKSAYPSIKGPMVLAIQKWVKRNALSSRRDTPRTSVTALSRKRKAVSELNTGRTTAYLIARKIKQKGLKKTGFFDNAVNEYFGDLFYQTMAQVVGADVRAVVRATDSLINKENK